MAMERSFGRYILHERIGLGGMAEVFLARTTGPGGFEMDVCVKRILPHCCQDDAFVKMFIDEARVVGRLRHANIVQILDFDEVEGSYYIAMEYVEGKDLRTLLKELERRGKRLSPGLAAIIAAEIARGLAYAHTRVDRGRRLEIIHRDISPHNVLLSLAGEVKISDFGIAKAAARLTHTDTGLIKGKLSYMSPEQARGRPLDQRSDQFAVGLVLYEMLCGQRAYSGDSQGELLKLAADGDVPSVCESRPDAPPDLVEVVRRSTSLDRDDRFPDMAEMERALRRMLIQLAPSPEDLDVGALLGEIFATSQRRPRTEVLLPSVTDLPPFDGEGSDATTREVEGRRTVQGGATEGTPTAPLDSTTARDGTRATLAHRRLRRLFAAAALVLAPVGAGYLLWPVRGSEPVTTGDPGPTPESRPASVPASTPFTSPPDAGSRPDTYRPADPPLRGARGRLTVLLRESWARVYLGKRFLGTTPLKEVPVPSGSWTIRIVNPETGKKRNLTRRIRPSEHVEILTSLPEP